MMGFDKLYKAMTRPFAMILVTLSIIFSFYFLDRPVALAIYSSHFVESATILRYATNIGIGAIYMVSFLLLALFFRFIYKNKVWELRMWFLWICVLISNIICGVLKISLGRARPELLFSDNLYGFYGFHKNANYWSFPSGHTTTIMGIMFALSVLFPRYFLLFLLSGIGMAVLRIILVQHYISDVIAAGYFSLIIVGFLDQRLSPTLLKKLSNTIYA